MARIAISRIAVAGLALMVLMMPSLAFADGPATTPQSIKAEGFEARPYANIELSWAFGDPVPPAYWGQATQRRHNGTYGLWCAGTVMGSTSAGWTKYAGKYPAYTGGTATMRIPEMTEYYSATLDYWYSMPSLGGLDRDSFTASWSRTGADFWSNQPGLTTVSTMTHTAVSLTAPTPDGSSRPVNLSRLSGVVRFSFFDHVPGTYETESPATGEGASIDDVAVSGFKYGPVQSLVADVNGGEVHLSWTVPARSTALGALPEERPVTYRVWRSPDSQPYQWTEVTQGRISSTALTDVEPLDGASRYVVQVWDEGMGTGYGEVQPQSYAAVTVMPPVPSTTVEVTGGVQIDGVYTEIPTVLVARSSAKGVTYYRWDSEAPVATSSQSFSVPARDGTHTLEAYSANSLGITESPHKTLTLRVRLASPAPAPVTSITATGAVNAAGTFTATPTVTVARDIADGVTYYRWDGGSYAATSSASFTVPAIAGTHTLEVFSVAGGVAESPGVTRVIAFVPVTAPVLTKPSLSTPTISTSYPRRYRTFYVRGTLKPSHAGATTVKVPLYRYYSGSYHFVKTYTVTVPSGATSYSVKLYLSKAGTYRAKAQHGCALHVSTYSSYKKFYVH